MNGTLEPHVTTMHASGCASSGRNIRHQLHSQQYDMIFQLQLAFLQPPQLQLFMMSTLREQVDHRIQIPVFDFQFNNAALYILAMRHGHDGFYC
jgi:hypothetical protein